MNGSGWDIECKGKRIKIRERKGSLGLVISANPPNGIIIEKMKMLYDEVKVESNKKRLKITGRNKIENKEGLKLIMYGLVVTSENGFIASPNGSIQFSGYCKSSRIFD